MSKKSWLGGSNDDAADADKAADKNPSSAGTQDPGLQSANQGADASASARPINILADDRNPETDDGSVNPSNSAAAQIPAVIPLDRATDDEAAAQEERLKRPQNDKDRADSLKQWGRDVRRRGGNVSSAEWERFQELTGERTPAPTAESIAKAERERNQGESDPAKRSTDATRTDRA